MESEGQVVVLVPGVGWKKVDACLDVAGRGLVGVRQLGLAASLQVEVRQLPTALGVAHTDEAGVEVGDDIEEILVTAAPAEPLQEEPAYLTVDPGNLGGVEERETRLLDPVVEEAVGDSARVCQFEPLEDEFVRVARGKHEAGPNRIVEDH